MTILEQRAYEAIASMAKKDEPDYWTRLEHQYAGMAMQILIKEYRDAKSKYGFSDNLIQETCAKESIQFAHALVENMKQDK